MATQSKGQQAALLRMQQISIEVTEKIAKIESEYSQSRYDLSDLDKDFDKYVDEMVTLAKEHSLDQSVLMEFKSKLAEEIYQKAGSIKCHAWQARFAKKHGM